MWSSPLFWIVVAVMVFWSLGAYNRLVRLKSAVQSADALWRDVLDRWMRMSHDWLAQTDPQAAAMDDADAGGPLAARARLLKASLAMEVALAAAPAGPSGHASYGPAGEAYCALQAAWVDMLAFADPVAQPECGPWRARAAELQSLTTTAAHSADQAIKIYQSAISQFPASVLARVCGFGAA